MTTIAGHSFKEGPNGRYCEYCSKRWVDIAGVLKENIGATGWAHSGELADHEYKQIVIERERLFELGRGM